jgi:hypothetical protein
MNASALNPSEFPVDYCQEWQGAEKCFPAPHHLIILLKSSGSFARKPPEECLNMEKRGDPAHRVFLFSN